MATFYLGVEGGATRSEAILADEGGRVIIKRAGRALNYHNLDKKRLDDNLKELLLPVLNEAGRGKIYAVFGLAGLDTASDEAFYKKTLVSILPGSVKFTVVNDAKIALEARCGDYKDKILVISGTGASVYGESGERTAKSIGWGLLLGDEGSSFQVGLKAMKAAVQSWDGRARKTALEGLVLKKAGAASMEDFIDKVYKSWHGRNGGIKEYVASFSPVVDEAINKKDRAAIMIRDEMVSELMKGVFAVAKRLNVTKKNVCIGIIGSSWNMPGLRKKFISELKKEIKGAYFSDIQDSGSWGAVLLAKKLRQLK